MIPHPSGVWRVVVRRGKRECLILPKISLLAHRRRCRCRRRLLRTASAASSHSHAEWRRCDDLSPRGPRSSQQLLLMSRRLLGAVSNLAELDTRNATCSLFLLLGWLVGWLTLVSNTDRSLVSCHPCWISWLDAWPKRLNFIQRICHFECRYFHQWERK